MNIGWHGHGEVIDILREIQSTGYERKKGPTDLAESIRLSIKRVPEIGETVNIYPQAELVYRRE